MSCIKGKYVNTDMQIVLTQQRFTLQNFSHMNFYNDCLAWYPELMLTQNLFQTKMNT
jgi:hypothetical protein